MADQAYTIVATLGPASPNREAATSLLDAGATALRLNTSHIGPDELDAWLDTLAPLASRAPLVLDLQGSKWRVAAMEPRVLAAGSRLELVLDPKAGVLTVAVPHPDFFLAAESSDGRVLLDDARIELHLDDVGDGRAAATVIRGGTLRGRKGITLPATTFRTETLTAADRVVVERARSVAGARFAVSYVRDAAEMASYRALLPLDHAVIAKLERPDAVAQVRDVARHCDELWVCRGDLGAEMGLAGMARAAARLTGDLSAIDRPVLMAGQVLEHMTLSPAPTRAEICHLHDVLSAGYSGVVLSDETAVGHNPVEAVRAAAMFR